MPSSLKAPELTCRLPICCDQAMLSSESSGPALLLMLLPDFAMARRGNSSWADAATAHRRPKDFDGSTLERLLSSAAADDSSVAFALPHLHAIGTTRTCIDLSRPSQKQFFWKGKSDGKWKSHELFRTHCDRASRSCAPRAAGADPCVVLEQASVPVPKTLLPSQRAAAAEILRTPLKPSLTTEQLHEKLKALQRAPTAAHFVLRRRLRPLNGSTLALGHRANLDVNVFNCPKHRVLVGCKGGVYEKAFLGAFRPWRPSDLGSTIAGSGHARASTRKGGGGGGGGGARRAGDAASAAEGESVGEWSDRISAAPPFKYCRRYGAAIAEAPVQRVPGVAVLLPELHGDLNVGHAAKDMVFLAHILQEQREAQAAAAAGGGSRGGEGSAGSNRSLVVSTILVDDKASATGNLTVNQQGYWYRRRSLEAMVAGLDPPVHIAYLQQGAHLHKEDFGADPQWQGSRSVCFDAVVQKGLAYAGDWRGAQLFREQTYAMCGIDPHAEADAVLVVIHGVAHSLKVTRRWHDQKQLVDSIKQGRFRTEWCGATAGGGGGGGGGGGVGDGGTGGGGGGGGGAAGGGGGNRTWRGGRAGEGWHGAEGGGARGGRGCKPLRMLVQGMEGLSFCEQAALYARSRVVVTHHGASLANGMFLRASSLMVEVNKQWDNLRPVGFAHTFDGAGYAGLFLSTGVAYIGARVAYGVWGSSLLRGGRWGNSGHPDPTDGAVRWRLDAHSPPNYDFNDASMEIGINATRWDDVLRAIDQIIIPPRPPQPPSPPSPHDASPPPPPGSSSSLFGLFG